MKDGRFDIAVSVEYVRGWGRRFCEGIAAYSHSNDRWRLRMFDSYVPNANELRRYDGLIWTVADESTAHTLLSIGKPVVNIASDGDFPGIMGVGSNHLMCGQMAARHFITHHATNFAFCGWSGMPFSDARQDAFVRTLERNHFPCRIYAPKVGNLRWYLDHCIDRELSLVPSDERHLAKWIREIPKPVGVFCSNDLRAWQLAEVCHREGVSVPTEVAILGADNDPVVCSFTRVPLSSVDTDTFETGRMAAEVLDDLMSGKRKKTDKTVQIKPIGVMARASTEVFPVNPPWLADILSYIHANTVRSLTAADIVAHAGRSYGTIENAFKRVLGTTVQRVIMSSRLDVAEHLLITTQLPISQVAVKSGFRSHQYFNRCFVDRNTMSPSEWREANARTS